MRFGALAVFSIILCSAFLKSLEAYKAGNKLISHGSEKFSSTTHSHILLFHYSNGFNFVIQQYCPFT